MAIVPLDKMTLYGAESQRDAVIQRLQELGCIHLVNLGSATDDDATSDLSTESHEALDYLLACPEQRRQVRRTENFDRDRVFADAIRLRREAEMLNDERDDLRKAVSDLQPWGDFRLPANRMVGDVRFWFYVVPHRDVAKAKDIGLPWREVSRDQENAYVVVLGRDEPQDAPGKRIDLDPRPLQKLRIRLEEVEEQLEELHHQRAGLTRWCSLLASTLDEADDAAARRRARTKTLRGTKVYALGGWVPRHASDRIRQFARENNLAVSIEPPALDDQPPTLLHNPEKVSGSEALVTFYKTPAYGSWDPSIIAYLSFALFFAMILADAGYGIVLAVLTAYLWKKMGKTPAGLRGRNVLLTVVGFTIVYGVLCGSYFGVSPSPESALGRLRILDAQSQSLMMPLTIMVGVIHLSVANVIMAWLQRGRATALASLGWVSVMAGAVVVAFVDVEEKLDGRLNQAGTVLMVSGLVAVFLFSSKRPLLSLDIKDHGLRIFDGLKGLTGISGLFGDVLSYLRLFALGLSSAKLSETFNKLGASAWDSAGFGVIAAIGIVILGHTLNLLLSIMSGVVHGLRLNCIEFFKYSLPEEGYMFKTFAKKARQP